jgi:predicted small secreted protein
MKSKTLLFALFILAALLLSACNVNFITDIKSDGSGTYIQEIGLPTEELESFGMNADEFCEEMEEDAPPGTTARKETRNEKETWCIFESNFASLDELKTIYATTDTRVNDISLSDGKLTYDITLDFSSDESIPGISVNWTVKMPGKVIESNATEQSGNTLTWKAAMGRENNIRAVSEVGGTGSGLSFDFDFDGNPLGVGIAAVLFLCLCCFVPLVIGGVAFFLIRKKKAGDSTEPPVAASMS